MFKSDETWNEATPQDIPSPTYWPVILALGITFIFWGFITTYIICITGFFIFIVGLTGWIAELRNALTSSKKNELSHES